MSSMASGIIGYLRRRRLLRLFSNSSYVQVAFKLESEETVQREFSPLLCIRDSYPKFVVTMDSHFQDTIEGVRHIGLYQFLTDEHLY